MLKRQTFFDKTVRSKKAQTHFYLRNRLIFQHNRLRYF